MTEPGGPDPAGPAFGDRRRAARRRLASLASLALTVIFLAAIAWFVRGRLDEFRAVWSAPIPKPLLAALPPAWLAMALANSELLRRCLLAYDLRLPFGEGLALTMASTAANHFVPKGGAGLRGLYLATRRGLGLANFLAAMVSVSVMTLTTASLFALAGLIPMIRAGHPVGPAPLAYFALTAAAGPLAVLFLGRLGLRLPGPLASLAAGWDAVRRTPGLLWRLQRLQVGFFLAWALVNWLCLSAFGVRLHPSGLVFYTAGQIHATLLNLTPAGLGVVEAVSVLAGRALDITPAQALSAQALSRLAAVAVLAPLGTWGWIRLARFRPPAKPAEPAEPTEPTEPTEPAAPAPVPPERPGGEPPPEGA